jgi:hypothetical protein
MEQVVLSMSAAGLEKLKQAAEHLRQGAEHLDSAGSLLVQLRETGELAILGDILGAETDLEASAAAVVD